MNQKLLMNKKYFLVLISGIFLFSINSKAKYFQFDILVRNAKFKQLKRLQYNAALLIQRYCKGYIASRGDWKKSVLDQLTTQMDAIKLRHQLDL